MGYRTVDWDYYVRSSPFVRMWPVQMYFVLIRNILLVIKYNWWLFRARIGADKCEPVSMTIGTAPTLHTIHLIALDFNGSYVCCDTVSSNSRAGVFGLDYNLFCVTLKCVQG